MTRADLLTDPQDWRRGRSQGGSSPGDTLVLSKARGVSKAGRNASPGTWVERRRCSQSHEKGHGCSPRWAALRIPPPCPLSLSLELGLGLRASQWQPFPQGH